MIYNIYMIYNTSFTFTSTKALVCISWHGISTNRALRRILSATALIHSASSLVIGESFLPTRTNSTVTVFDIILALEDFLEKVGKALAIAQAEAKASLLSQTTYKEKHISLRTTKCLSHLLPLNILKWYTTWVNIYVQI